jgi:hypothetical protein
MYPETLSVYMALQQLAEAHATDGRIRWASLGLVRLDEPPGHYVMPVPPGRPMVKVCARPFLVLRPAIERRDRSARNAVRSNKKEEEYSGALVELLASL